MIKALIFDFDGLILDTESPDAAGWKAIYAEYGQEFPMQVWLNEAVGTTQSDFDPAAHLAAVTGLHLDLPSLHERVRLQSLQELSTSSTMPGVSEYLHSAREKGLRLAVASSSGHAWVEGHLRRLGLLENFQAVICKEDVRNVKPDPELFLKALSVLGLPAEAALALEDSLNGVRSARAAGLRVVAVPNPVTRHGDFPGASLRLSSLADMPLEELLHRLDLEIGLETNADIPGIRLVEQRAFQRDNEANLVDLCRRRGRIVLSMVARGAGEILGHILFTPVRLEPPGDARRGLGLGPIAVLPECQRSGIGSQLMHAGLGQCRAQGYDYVVLLGDPGYYSRFGFRPARNFGLTSDYGDGEEFQALELRSGALAGVQGKVKYVPEFQEMEC